MIGNNYSPITVIVDNYKTLTKIFRDDRVECVIADWVFQIVFRFTHHTVVTLSLLY